MIHPEAEPAQDGAHERAEEDVEAMVAKIGIPGAGDVDCQADGYEREEEEVDGRGGGLRTERCLMLLCGRGRGWKGWRRGIRTGGFLIVGESGGG